MDTYGPYLLHQLGMMMDKTKICQSVHLCKPSAGQVQLLGGKFCTFGPAYWCVSKEHAIACNVSAIPVSFYLVANAIVFFIYRSWNIVRQRSG